MEPVGAVFRRHRDDRGLTQEEFATLVGARQADVSRLERGQGRFRADTLLKWCRALELTDEQRSEILRLIEQQAA